MAFALVALNRTPRPPTFPAWLDHAARVACAAVLIWAAGFGGLYGVAITVQVLGLIAWEALSSPSQTASEEVPS